MTLMSVVPWLLAILSGLGLLLSLAIVVPAPTMFLLVFTVVAPEISPWLVGFHAIALLLLARLSLTGGVAIAILICSLLGLSLSLLPPAASSGHRGPLQRGNGTRIRVSVSQKRP